MLKQKYVKLDNGLQVIIDKMENIESITIKILIKVGSRDECGYKDGISHFIEHMQFKGTNTRTAHQIAKEFDMIGGHLNAYTSIEQTVYYAKVLKNDIEKSIEILSDMMKQSVYSEEELAREKQVVVEEIHETNDDPSSIVFEVFRQQMYKDYQVGKSILGTIESVESITRDDILKYIEKYYRYDNTIIAISGNIDEEYGVDLISKYFNGAGCLLQSQRDNALNSFVNNNVNKDNNECINISSPKYVGGYIDIERDIEQIHFVLGFNGASFNDDFYVYQIAAMIAGGGMSSRLFQEVREKRGLAYSISAFTSIYKDFGSWEVYFSSKSQQINESIGVVIEELHKMTTDINEDELKRAKVQIKSSLLMAQESTSNRAEKIIGNYAIFGRFITYEEIIQKVESITIDDIQNTMKKIITSSKVYRPTIAMIGKMQDVNKYEEIIRML